MFYIEKEDKTIHITRGDAAAFKFYRKGKNTGEVYNFIPGDVVRFTVTRKKGSNEVVLQKDFAVTEETESVAIVLTKEETKIGDAINKPVDYWYEIEVNPFSAPKTYVGYDEDGAKIFKLYPEGVRDGEGNSITEEDIPVVDVELDLTSTRPVQNQAIARAITKIADDTDRQIQGLADEMRSKIVTEVAKKFEDKDEQIDLIIEEVVTEFRGRVDEEVANAIRNIAGEIYTTENKPTAADVGAVPNTGGMFSDSIGAVTEEKKDIVLRVQNSEHNGTLYASNWGCFGVWSDTLGKFLYAADKNGTIFCDGVNTNSCHFPIHTGNKPYGTYKGTGVSRAIPVGGIGRVLFIWSDQAICYVTSIGWAGLTGQSANSGGAGESNTAYFSDGQLHIVISDSTNARVNFFNKSGTTYYYQVL